MTTAERITKAGNSKNLTLDVRDGSPDGDAAVLIACGLTPTQLGGHLHHLRGEWDGTAKPFKLTASEALMLVNSLKSLNIVVTLVQAWAARKGRKDPLRSAQEGVSYWLDNTCHHCYGRGKLLMPGTTRLGNNCGKCSATGKRAEPDVEMQNMLDACDKWHTAAAGNYLRG